MNKGLKNKERCISSVFINTNPKGVVIEINNFISNSISNREKAFSRLYEKLLSYSPPAQDIFEKDGIVIKSKETKESKTIKLGKPLGSIGFNSTIFTGYVDDKDVIIKFPKTETDKDLYEFIAEGIIQILLQCFQDDIMTQVSTEETGFEWPFVRIEIMSFVNFGSQTLLPMIGVEKVDYDLYDYLENNPSVTREDLCDIFLQIALYLYYLQKILGFRHRDLHNGNVFLKKRKYSIPKKYKIGMYEVEIASTHRVYFGDLANVCINFNKCWACNMDPIVLISGNKLYDRFDPEKIVCDNVSQDMMSIIHTSANLNAAWKYSFFRNFYNRIDKWFDDVDTTRYQVLYSIDNFDINPRLFFEDLTSYIHKTRAGI